jgi:hypothetical protein
LRQIAADHDRIRRFSALFGSCLAIAADRDDLRQPESRADRLLAAKDW